jgi:hypothetical protein
MLAMFDKPEGLHTRTVEFQTANGVQVVGVINEIQAEDGSRESWNIVGHFTLKPPVGVKATPGQWTKIYYNTVRREGFFIDGKWWG